MADTPDEPMEPTHRDYHQLLRVLDDTLAALLDPDAGDPLEALCASFEGAAAAFGAEKALVIATWPTFRVVRAIGLTEADVRGVEAGESSPGVSSSVVREALESARPVLIRDPRHERATHTRALRGKPYSVLCAPVLDPSAAAARVLGILYFQNHGFANAFVDNDLTWVTTYARALGWTLHAVAQAAQLRELQRAAGPEIVGDSPVMGDLIHEIDEVWVGFAERTMPAPLLLLGPSGSGKELVARYIHAGSCRARRPFLAVNCAQMTRELAASTLFGHKRGSFTGADRDRPGVVRDAEKGVLLLDELGALPQDVQGQLLRVLDTHEVLGVGESVAHRVDVWIMLATSADLESTVEAGTFSVDLWNRIKTHQIRVPSLAERAADISTLAYHFLHQQERRDRKRTLGFDADAMAALLAYSWPGNVRELAGAVEALFLRTPGGRPITRELIGRVLPKILREVDGEPVNGAPAVPRPNAALRTLVDDFRRRVVLQTIRAHDGDVRAASKALGVPWGTFSDLLKRYGLSKRRRFRNRPTPDDGPDTGEPDDEEEADDE